PLFAFRQTRCKEIENSWASLIFRQRARHLKRHSELKDSVVIHSHQLSICSMIYNVLSVQACLYQIGAPNCRLHQVGGSWSIATSRKIPSSPRVLSRQMNASPPTHRARTWDAICPSPEFR